MLFERRTVLHRIASGIQELDKDFDCLVHGHASQHGGTLVGEYADESARLIYFTGDSFAIFEPYRTDGWVRHIHSVIAYKNGFLVATGDSAKYLDHFHVKNNELVRVSRLIHNFAGFTAACEVRGKVYFGSDFSSRPNYIYCLSTHRKFFFPAKSYRHFCVAMIVVDDRYIASMNYGLPLNRIFSVCLFDTETGEFISSDIHSDIELIPPQFKLADNLNDA
jgi:hypothetical protein